MWFEPAHQKMILEKTFWGPSAELGFISFLANVNLGVAQTDYRSYFIVALMWFAKKYKKREIIKLRGK